MAEEKILVGVDTDDPLRRYHESRAGNGKERNIGPKTVEDTANRIGEKRKQTEGRTFSGFCPRFMRYYFSKSFARWGNMETLRSKIPCI